MAESQAQTGHGTTFSHRTAVGPPAVYAQIGEGFQVQPPQPTRETVDVTHLTSPDATREFRGTLRDPGEASVSLNWTEAAYMKVAELFYEEDPQHFRIGYKGGATEDFVGIVTGMPSDPIEVDGVHRFSMPIKVTGKPVFTPSEP